MCPLAHAGSPSRISKPVFPLKKAKHPKSLLKLYLERGQKQNLVAKLKGWLHITPFCTRWTYNFFSVPIILLCCLYLWSQFRSIELKIVIWNLWKAFQSSHSVYQVRLTKCLTIYRVALCFLIFVILFNIFLKRNNNTKNYVS